jgi:MoxR-like ATPase
MSEQQVSLDGVTHQLPSPFIVIATQNDVHATGTFPLPEPQLDRFLLSIRMELPTTEVQTSILLGHAVGEIHQHSLTELLGTQAILDLQKSVDAVYLDPKVAAYITSLGDTLRRLSGAEQSVSIRALLNVMQAARAKAFLEGSKAVHPDHVQAIFANVMRHRLQPDDGTDPQLLIDAAVDQTAVP